MAQLAKCLECGKPISPAASDCPHCHARFPNGVECAICMKAVRHSIAVKHPEREYLFFHPACYNNVQHFNWNCPICKNKITEVVRTCSNCGHPFGASECKMCRLPLLEEMAEPLRRDKGVAGYVHKECQKHRTGISAKRPCFIATAACGADAPSVQLLRKFRDERLLPHTIGRAFVLLYERVSPPLARLIEGRPLLRLLTRRCVVQPLARAVQRWIG